MVARIDELLQLQETIKAVYVDELVEEYIVSLSTATRHHEDVYLGASARGSLALYRTAQAWAAIRLSMPGDSAMASVSSTHWLDC